MNGEPSQHPEPPTRAQNRTALAILIGFAVIAIGGGRLMYVSNHQGGSNHQGSAASSGGMMRGAGSGSAAPAVQVNGLTAEFAGELRTSGSEIQITFKDGQGQLVDVGNVKLEFAMNMPGMAMHSG